MYHVLFCIIVITVLQCVLCVPCWARTCVIWVIYITPFFFWRRLWSQFVTPSTVLGVHMKILHIWNSKCLYIYIYTHRETDVILAHRVADHERVRTVLHWENGAGGWKKKSPSSVVPSRSKYTRVLTLENFWHWGMTIAMSALARQAASDQICQSATCLRLELFWLRRRCGRVGDREPNLGKREPNLSNTLLLRTPWRGYTASSPVFGSPWPPEPTRG